MAKLNTDFGNRLMQCRRWLMPSDSLLKKSEFADILDKLVISQLLKFVSDDDLILKVMEGPQELLKAAKIMDDYVTHSSRRRDNFHDSYTPRFNKNKISYYSDFSDERNSSGRDVTSSPSSYNPVDSGTISSRYGRSDHHDHRNHRNHRDISIQIQSKTFLIQILVINLKVKIL